MNANQLEIALRGQSGDVFVLNPDSEYAMKAVAVSTCVEEHVPAIVITIDPTVWAHYAELWPRKKIELSKNVVGDYVLINPGNQLLRAVVPVKPIIEGYVDEVTTTSIDRAHRFLSKRGAETWLEMHMQRPAARLRWKAVSIKTAKTRSAA